MKVKIETANGSRFLLQSGLGILILTGCAPVAPAVLTAEPTTLAVTPSAAAPAMSATPQSPPPSITRVPTAPTPSATLQLLPPSITRVPTTSPTPQKSTSTPQPPLTLKVTAPQDETIVQVASIAVIGQTTASAVVSVNGDLVEVDAGGRFQTTVTLDEGPNIIEVVASDENGNELGVILRVIYEP